MRYLATIIMALFALPAAAQFQREIPHYSNTSAPIPCAPNTVVVFTDDPGVGDCNEAGGGSINSVCACDDSGTGYDAVGAGSGGSPSLPVPDTSTIVEGSGNPTRLMRFEVDVDKDGGPGVTAGNTRVMHVPDEDIDLHDSKTDHEGRYGIFNVVDYGADNTATTDSTTAFQDAMDACDAVTQSLGRSGVVYFPPGDYSINDTIEWKACNIAGAGINQGTRIQWDGNNTTTAIERCANNATACQPGGLSQAFMKNIHLVYGSESPAYWLEMGDPTQVVSSDLVDNGLRFEEVQFKSGEEGIILVHNGWINFHMHNVRFDFFDNYAIKLITRHSMTWGSIAIDQFTADMRQVDGHGGNPLGLLQVYAYDAFGDAECVGLDDPYACCTGAGTGTCGGHVPPSVGIVSIEDGRVESSITACEGCQLVNTYIASIASGDEVDGSGGVVQFDVDNVIWDNGSPTDTVSCWFGVTTGLAQGGWYEFEIENSVGRNTGGTQTLLCGDWTTNLVEPPEPAKGIWNIRVGFGDTDQDASFSMNRDGAADVLIGGWAQTNSPVLAVRDENQSDITTNKWSIDEQGRMLWGGGAGAEDVQLERNAANELSLASGDMLCFEGATECIRYDVTAGCLYYDQNNDDTCQSGEELSANCTACP